MIKTNGKLALKINLAFGASATAKKTGVGHCNRMLTVAVTSLIES